MLLPELRRRSRSGTGFPAELLSGGFNFWSPEYIPAMKRNGMTGVVETAALVPRACLSMFTVQLRVSSPCYSVSKDENEDSMLSVCFLLFEIFCVYFFCLFFFLAQQ